MVSDRPDWRVMALEVTALVRLHLEDMESLRLDWRVMALVRRHSADTDMDMELADQE